MQKSTLGEIVVAMIFAGFCFFAYQSKQNYDLSKTNLAKADSHLTQVNNHTKSDLIETGKGIVYLKPHGDLDYHDQQADEVNNIIKKTFTYKSPEGFKTNIKWVMQHADGPFYDWWLKGGIEHNYNVLVDFARGRSYTRFMKDYSLTKYDKNHYFAILQSGTLIGTSDQSSIIPDQYALDIRKDPKNDKWRIVRISGFISIGSEN